MRANASKVTKATTLKDDGQSKCWKYVKRGDNKQNNGTSSNITHTLALTHTQVLHTIMCGSPLEVIVYETGMYMNSKRIKLNYM